MIRLYEVDAGRCTIYESTTDLSAPSEQTAWIDLYNPTPEEERWVEARLSLDIPTREEMREIETSSRLYVEDAAVFMTATVITNADAPRPESVVVTFVLTPRALVTVRYAEPKPFETFASQVQRNADLCAGPEAAFVGLVDAIVNRIADILETTSAELETFSYETFAVPGQRKDFQQQLSQLGRVGDLLSKARESLVTLSLLVAFARKRSQLRADPDILDELRTLEQDSTTLAEYVAFLSSKTTFLLDATLGMINIEQNAIIKIFSVVAVMFLPPTLIASIYGMNFEHMPELSWALGYPLALVAMVISMIIPYLFFKYKGWL